MITKAKLIKTGDKQYYLNTGKMDGLHLACYPHDITKQRLSLKNCQAVENGYDLDEYQEGIFYAGNFGHPSPEGFSDEQVGRLHGFIDGFQKALELLGDKKFSERDIKKIIHWSTLDEDVRLSEEEFFQSLQQTEWDVEIVMEKVQSRLYIEPHKEEEYKSKPIELQHPYTTNPDEIWEYKPKLDSEGCLILKRIQL